VAYLSPYTFFLLGEDGADPGWLNGLLSWWAGNAMLTLDEPDPGTSPSAGPSPGESSRARELDATGCVCVGACVDDRVERGGVVGI